MDARARDSRQNGQSLVEFLVALVVLVPLLLMLPLLGKYSDMNQAALEASRYAAWEKTVAPGKSDAVLADEVRGRFFGNLNRPIKANDVAQDGVDADRNAFWTDHRGGKLLARFQDVSLQTSHSTPSGLAGALSQAGAWFGLKLDNLYRADVGVNVANVAGLAPLDKIGLHISRHNVILADAWDAGKVDNEYARVHGSPMVPTHWLQGNLLGTLTKLIKGAGSLFEPALAQLEFGYVKPDEVPHDRRP